MPKITFPLKQNKISLKFKIAILFIVLVLGIMLTVTYIFTIRELELRRTQVELRMERLANNIATIRSVETEDWDIYQTYIENQIKLNSDIVYIVIFDEQGELKANSLNINWIEIDNPENLTKSEQVDILLRLDQRQIAEESQADLESKSVNIIIGEKNLGTVKVGFSLVELNDGMKKNLNRNLQLAAIFIVIAIITAYFISHKIVTPLGKLTAAMLKISQGDLNQELHIKSHDEIGEMAKTFNYMTTGLQEKQIIEKFSRELVFTIELQKITELITEKITTSLHSKLAYLFLNDKADTTIFRLISTYPANEQQQKNIECSEQLCKYWKSVNNPILLYLFSKYPTFKKSAETLAEINDNSLVCPIIIKHEIIGILLLSQNNSDIPYSDNEKEFLGTLISQGTFAIESALLYEELTEQERLKRELEIATMVQNSLLPQKSPQIPDLIIDGLCIPATEIGGDYYDYFKIDDNNIGIVIADVSGKGTSAAFYMAVVKGIMLSLTSIYKSPKKLLIEMNKRLFLSMEQKVFITMIYATINLKSNTITLSRAGHNSLLYRNAQTNQVQSLTPDGIALGLEKGDIFNKIITEQKIKYQKGDLFFFFTDGISEAMDKDRNEFSEQQLIDIITESNFTNPQQLQKEILDAINNHVHDAPQHDDITIVSVTAT